MKVLIGILVVALTLQHFADAVTTDDKSTILPPPPIVCNCPLIYKPVCGTDGKTYSNECVLKCVSADNVSNGRPPIFVSKPGACPQVPCICPAVVQPVCGSDGHTYSNACFLGCENKRRQLLKLPPIHIVSQGQCPLPWCYCSGVIIPVCGTDGKSYRNVCYLQCASKLNQAQGYPPIFLHSIGPCAKESCTCPKIYKPVCASDGKTYNNECLLKCENRRRYALGQPPLVIKYNGPCTTCPCPNIFDPVCASDGKTYPSLCWLGCENDARKKVGLPPLKVQYKGVCGCKCGNNYDPVCGSDDVTYKNICWLNCESLKRQQQGLKPIWLSYLGPCVCNCKNCSTLFSPVCGSDGKTYWNICWLQCHSKCNIKKGLPKINFVKNGYC